jgi:hypothetical protein
VVDPDALPPDAMDFDLAPALRLEVRALVTTAGTRRRLPTTVHVGEPWGERRVVRDPGDLDEGLCVDLVTRALDGLADLTRACTWLTRSGPLGLTDADAAWLAAARAAFARHGLELPAFVVLNRTGWVDHVSDARRTWSRVRPFPAAAVPRRVLEDPWW